MGLRDKLRKESRSRVRMLHSVVGDGLDLVAGEQYDLPVSVADEFIVKGYAEGNLSRPHSADEINEMHAQRQVVSI